MGGSGGHRRLPGGSDDFSWHTDRQTLHHNIYIIIIIKPTKILIILLPTAGPWNETAHIPNVNRGHNTPLLPALISFAASSSSTSPEYHDFHFHHLWTFTISFVCGAQSHNRGSTETGRAITITTTCEKGPRAGLIVAVPKKVPTLLTFPSDMSSYCPKNSNPVLEAQ